MLLLERVDLAQPGYYRLCGLGLSERRRRCVPDQAERRILQIVCCTPFRTGREAAGVYSGAAGVYPRAAGVYPSTAGVCNRDSGVCSNGSGVYSRAAGVCYRDSGVYSRTAGVYSRGAGVYPSAAGVYREDPPKCPNRDRGQCGTLLADGNGNESAVGGGQWAGRRRETGVRSQVTRPNPVPHDPRTTNHDPRIPAKLISALSATRR